MTCRIENGQTFLQSYNTENRMSGVALVTGDCNSIEVPSKTWLFTYDGDGSRVKQVYTEETSTLTNYYFAGDSYEIETDGTTETVRQYYAIAGMSVGMREASTFYYFLTDQLGSVVGVTDGDGELISETRYLPFGEARTDVGAITQTDFGYTFQKNNTYIKLLDYRSRSYSAELGRFVSPDTIVPDLSNPQTINRYSYVNNRPVNFNDPSGHCAECIIGGVMAVGAVAGGIYSWVTQHNETGKVDSNILVGDMLTGAVVGGALVLASAAVVTTFSALGPILATTACADGDCTNEIRAGVGAAENGVNQEEKVLSRGISAVQDLISRSKSSIRSPGKVFENSETKQDALKWFFRIADPDTIKPHQKVSGGLLGRIFGSDEGVIGFRPYSSSPPHAPTIDLHNFPGLDPRIEIKFLGDIFRSIFKK